jgi:hypothetical protein
MVMATCRGIKTNCEVVGYKNLGSLIFSALCVIKITKLLVILGEWLFIFNCTLDVSSVHA